MSSLFSNYEHGRSRRRQEAARRLQTIQTNPASALSGAQELRWLAKIVGDRLIDQMSPLFGNQPPSRAQVRQLTEAIRILRPDLFSTDAPEPSPVSEPAQQANEQRQDSLQGRRGESESRDSRYVLGVDPDEAIYRGEMIPVTSSNVHSIGFLWNDAQPAQGTLLVRYLQSNGPRMPKTGGPSYRYMGVHPNVYQLFIDAASKGIFVWDRLRVRGTVSGHQYDYRLSGISGGYVPRQATRRGDREYYVPRSIVTRNRQGVERQRRSSLGEQMVRTLPGGRRIPLVQRAGYG